jgi:hypothetical protein
MDRRILAAGAVLLVLAQAAAGSDDRRLKVEMPDMMTEHMLGNMRDHLAALSEIQAALGEGRFDAAAQIAETRIGMSSLAAHGASHMAPYMPKDMQEIGTQMHRAASRFAISAQEAAVSGDTRKAVEDLAKVTQQCVACHAAFRVR